MDIALTPASIADKPLLVALAQEGEAELARLFGAGGLGVALPALDCYLSAPEHCAFLIAVDGAPVGFALVGPGGVLLPFDGHTVDSFYVAPAQRRQGVGRLAAGLLFEHFPGQWEIATPVANVRGAAFWRGVIDRYTGGRYTERWVQNVRWSGLIHRFVV